MCLSSPTVFEISSHRVLALIGAIALPGCVIDMPSRAVDGLDAEVDARGDLAVLPGDRGLPGDLAPRPDAAPPVRDLAVRADAAPPPPDGPAGDAGPGTEICDGLDNDADGETDEGGDEECVSRRTTARYCLEGACKSCDPETNAGCGARFRCVAARGDNVCAQCTPNANNCPGEAPYCSPSELICLACPELVSYGEGQFGNRCRGEPFQGHCVYLFPSPPDVPVSCVGLCQAIGMGCAGGWFSEPALPDAPPAICHTGEALSCEGDRLGDLICDCIQ
jgi:hypothetical protein